MPSCKRRRWSVTSKSVGKKVFAELTFLMTLGRNIVKLLVGELQLRSSAWLQQTEQTPKLTPRLQAKLGQCVRVKFKQCVPAKFRRRKAHYEAPITGTTVVNVAVILHRCELKIRYKQ